MFEELQNVRSEAANYFAYLKGLRRWAQSIIEPSYILTLSKPACFNCKYLCDALVPE
jgi:hypothetical protein